VNLLDFLQSASNTAAGNVAGPVDLISSLLNRLGVPVQNAVGGSDWMKQKGLMRDVQQSPSSLAGETFGLLGPLAAAAKAPQIASGLLRAGENAAVPRTMHLQRGAIPVSKPPYQIDHAPMTEAGGASRLHDLVPAFGEDIYGKNALQFFGSGDAREKAVVKALAAVRGKPDATVTIYRGGPKEMGSINSGDWVTLSKEAAADYASQHPGGRIVEMKVPASHITAWPDSLLEFGYFPK
jgi:hypothetical protein